MPNLSMQAIDNEHYQLFWQGKRVISNFINSKDFTVFFVIDDLPDQQEDYLSFANELFPIVSRDFGGKILVRIANNITGEKRLLLHQALHTAGFANQLSDRIIALTRDGIERAMREINAKIPVQTMLKTFAEEGFQIITDRRTLLDNQDAILNLLEHSGYMRPANIVQGNYSRAGIAKRLQHPDADFFALIQQDKYVGFLGIIYFGDSAYGFDLVIDEQVRQKHYGQLFFYQVYQAAFDTHKNTRNVLLISGGDPQQVKMREHLYLNVLHGQRVSELTQQAEFGLYANFFEPGPKLLQAANCNLVKDENGFYLSHDPLEQDDLERLKRLGAEEIVKKIQVEHPSFKKNIRTSLLALIETPGLGLHSPTKKQEAEKDEIQQPENISIALPGLNL